MDSTVVKESSKTQLEYEMTSTVEVLMINDIEDAWNGDFPTHVPTLIRLCDHFLVFCPGQTQDIQNNVLLLHRV